MPVDAELLDILARPACKMPVTLVKDGKALKCGPCHRVYPIKDDIPVMLIDEATIEKYFQGFQIFQEFHRHVLSMKFLNRLERIQNVALGTHWNVWNLLEPSLILLIRLRLIG